MAASSPPIAPSPSPSFRPPSLLRLAWRQGWRDLRGGELSLLLIAVALAVAALSAVGFFAERLQSGLSRDAQALLGGDAVLVADQPLPPVLAERARALGLKTSASVGFPSMARAPEARGGASRLVAVKAVDAAYPLRGALQLADGPEADAARTRSLRAAPPRGAVWVDAALLDALQLQVGDRLGLGDADLRIDAVLRIEPDRGAGFLSFAPRVMLHLDDLAATGLVQPASRVSHRLAVALPAGGEAAAVTRYLDETRLRISQEGWRGLQLESLEAGRPEMAQTLDRAASFLRLVALLAALLAAVAVAIAARHYADRHLDESAMLRVLGQSQRRIAGAYALGFGVAGLAASAVGLLIGLAVHQVFVWLLGSLVGAELPPPGPAPALLGLGVGMSLLLGFGLPPVLQLAQVPALRVIRRELGRPRAVSLLTALAGLAGFGAMLWATAATPRLGAIVVGGFAMALLLFAAAGGGVMALLRQAVPAGGAALRLPRPLRLATRQLAARPVQGMVQVAALSVGLLALVLLVLLRTDLIASWREATPPDAPNRFVINIQPDQTEAFRAHLAEAGVARYDWYPMIRGRLSAINGQPVRAGQFATERANRLVEREFNLSHAAEAPAHNRLVAGRWDAAAAQQAGAAAADAPQALSVEEGLAQELGLKLGDRLRFDIAGQAQEGVIRNLRQVDWASMRVNFFVMFERAAMPELPVTWIAAFQAPPRPPGQAGPGFDSRLSQAFPNVTVVDLSATLAQVQRVLDQVVRAVEFLFAFTLAAGLLVLLAAIRASREQRLHEAAVMRALGAGRKLMAQVLRVELLGLGALAGALASVVAMGLGAALARYAFEFRWTAPLWVPLAGAAAGALLALLAGSWGLRGLLARPVVETLRRSSP